MRNMVTGGMSEQEARRMLLERGIFAFKCLAGSLPQKECDLSKFSDIELIFDGDWYEGIYEDEYWFADKWGEVRGIRIKLHENICYDCHGALRKAFQQISETLYFYQVVEIGCCAVCGKWEDDAIPF